MRIILFDIDGTLLHPHGAGRRALERALQLVFSPKFSLDGVNFGGSTDRQIIWDGLQKNGFDPAQSDGHLEQVFNVLPAVMQEEMDLGNIERLPGVTRLLKALSKIDDVELGLLTGNMGKTAPIKLAAAGIEPGLFKFGAYGDEARLRNDLPPLALARACEVIGLPLRASDVVIVGDTPADIGCARAHGMGAVAVATGFSTVEDLTASAPDHLLMDFRDLERVLETLGM